MQSGARSLAMGVTVVLWAAGTAAGGNSTFRIGALSFDGRTGYEDSDQKMQVLYDGLNVVLAAQERAGTPLDLIVASEALTMFGMQGDVAHMAQAIPGPRSGSLAAIAAAHHTWLVSGLLEADTTTGRTRLYNSAIVLDRSGKLVGKYRKVNLPPEDVAMGIQPGRESVVVNTEFGPMGLLICIDADYPKYIANLMTKKPYFVVHPSQANLLYDLRTAAEDYGVYFVSAVYDGPSRIFDTTGKILAELQYDGTDPLRMKVAVADLPRSADGGGGGGGGVTGDVNGDGTVDLADLEILVSAWASRAGDATYNQACDFDRDGIVGIDDVLLLAANWGRK